MNIANIQGIKTEYENISKGKIERKIYLSSIPQMSGESALG